MYAEILQRGGGTNLEYLKKEGASSVRGSTGRLCLKKLFGKLRGRD